MKNNTYLPLIMIFLITMACNKNVLKTEVASKKSSNVGVKNREIDSLDGKISQYEKDWYKADNMFKKAGKDFDNAIDSLTKEQGSSYLRSFYVPFPDSLKDTKYYKAEELGDRWDSIYKIRQRIGCEICQMKEIKQQKIQTLKQLKAEKQNEIKQKIQRIFRPQKMDGSLGGSQKIPTKSI